ncbi:MAG: phage holin family protein [Candidatus Saccharibacteria bacterium]|nr:phage holin family protein [Candidatus Saccharibacteria bacterium]
MQGRQLVAVILVRWVLNSLGLWVAATLLGSVGADLGTASAIAVFLLAGLIFSIVNSVVKPIVVILSLPAILLTLGLFTLIVNGLMVYITLALVPEVSMTFGASILAGIIMSLVNYIVSNAFDAGGLYKKENS